MTTWGIVLAAGSGTRFGAAKQFLSVGGMRVVDRSVATAAKVCDAVVVVLPAGVQWDGAPVAATAVGGATRAASVRAGLECVDPDAEFVLVHDAARALASETLWRAVRNGLHENVDAVIPGLPVSDTLKRVVGDVVVGTVDREHLIAVQTPQGFRAASLRAAHAVGGDATDDAAFIEAHGGTVHWVTGEAINTKLTRPQDAAIMEAVLAKLEDYA
ncbi:MAG: IspD/TarI family cytidylyltransferase [Acidimicrobiia bacterium]